MSGEITFTIDGAQVRGQAGQTHPAGRGDGQHLHSSPVRQTRPDCLGKLPRVYRAGQRPAAGGVHPAHRRGHRGRERHRGPARHAPRAGRDALRRGQPLLSLLREERQLRAAGHGLSPGHAGAAVSVFLPGARRGRQPPRPVSRPQPLHPVRALRARLARAGRQARVRLRGSRRAQARGRQRAHRAGRDRRGGHATWPARFARWAR